MPALRQRKRAASPVDDGDTQAADPPKKQARKGKASATAADTQKATKPKATKGKAAATKTEPADEDDDGEVAADAADDAVKPADPEPSSAQYATGANLVIPVDEVCPLTVSHKVYIDPSDGIIYDAALNQTNSGANNNKFYKLQILTDANGDFKCWTRWGRVGERGQNAILGDGTLDDAMRNYEKKFKEKTGLQWKDRTNDPKPKKYVFVERSYEPESDDDEAKPDTKTKVKPEDDNDDKIKIEAPECKLEKPLESLMELIFNQQHIASTMADLNYDAAKLPLGKLSKQTITRGYEALKKLAAVLDEPSLAASEYNNSLPAVSEQFSNLYYSLIPHDFGRLRPPVISSIDHVKKEVQLLESLTDLKDADAILKMEKKSTSNVHPMDARYEGLKMQAMECVNRESDEFKGLSAYLNNTRGATHGHSYEVLDIFRIERQGEHDRFNKSKYASIPSDRRLLWHGSRSTNFGGILSQGLRIAPPEAPVSGYMFGKGVYLADMSSKSANYCCSYISGGHALLLLCEAELGAPMQELTNSSYNAGEDALKAGLHSTWGKGMTAPPAWKDAGDIHADLAGIKIPDTSQAPGDTNVPNAYLQYNEFICYDVSQIRLRYLLRVKM